MKKVFLMFALAAAVATSCRKDIVFDDGKGNDGGKKPACEAVIADDGAFDNISSSGTHISKAWIEGDNLKLDVGYSGCDKHNFDMHWNGSWIKTYPAQTTLQLVDNNGGQLCQAYFQETLCFDISKLKNGSHGEIIIKLQNHDDISVRYKY